MQLLPEHAPRLRDERLAGGGKSRATSDPLYRILHDEPNDETDAFQFFDQMQAWLVNWGNARAEIQRDGSGNPVALWPIHPTRIPAGNIKRDKASGRIVWHVKNENAPDAIIADADMLNIVGPLSDDGVTGKGAIRMARESIGLGLATERYGAAFFGKGATPAGVLTHPGRLKDEARKNMRRSWKELYGNASGGQEVAILEEGVKWEKVSIPPEDAQFLTTRQHNITEIARWYRIPPHMLADLSRATFSNIEQQGIDFVVYSLRPWLCRWERALTRKLLLPAEKSTRLIEFLVDALLRGDMLTRMQAHQIAFMNGFISQDEVREIENRNPLPDGIGQQYYRPQNLAPIDAAADNAEIDTVDTAGVNDAMIPTDETSPMETNVEAAATGDVQATALNGAQIASLIQVSTMVVDGTFNQQAARAIIDASFPLLSDAEIDAIVDNLEAKPKEEPLNVDEPSGSGEGSGADGAPTAEEPQGTPADEGGEDQGGPALSAQGNDATAIDAERIRADWLRDTANRMRRREMLECERAAKHPERFIDRIEAFYKGHVASVAEAVAPILGDDATAWAERHCEAGRQAVVSASECQPHQLALSVHNCFGEVAYE